MKIEELGRVAELLRPVKHDHLYRDIALEAARAAFEKAADECNGLGDTLDLNFLEDKFRDMAKELE